MCIIRFEIPFELNEQKFKPQQIIQFYLHNHNQIFD